MTTYSNIDLANVISNIAATIDTDPHGGIRNYVLKKLLDASIIDTMPVSALDPHRDLPHDWTACQIAIFDNGEPVLKRKRAKAQRTKVRWGGNIKIWTREKVNFNLKTQVAWQANFYLWDHDMARSVVADMLEEKLIDADTHALAIDAIDTYGDQCLYAIPLNRGEGGTRWLRGHLIVASIEGKAVTRLAIRHPADDIATDRFSNELATGDRLKGNVISQARVDRHGHFALWSS